MADNLKILENTVQAVINPAAPPGGILAAEHNILEKAIIAQLGRYTGFPFLAKRSPTAGKIPAGQMFWNGRAMNKNDAPFALSFSDQTADANKFGRILSLMTADDIIKIKDYEGRSTTLKFLSSTQLADPDGLIYHDVTVIGFPENTNYSYQASDSWPCMVEFVRAATTPGATFSDYDQVFTFSGDFEEEEGDQYVFEVEPGMLNTSVKIGDGNFLTRGVGYDYTGNTVTILPAAYDLLEDGTKINIKGIY